MKPSDRQQPIAGRVSSHSVLNNSVQRSRPPLKIEPPDTGNRALDRGGPDSTAAFEELFTRLYPRVCTFVNAMLRSPAEAEDVAQDAFLEYWKRSNTAGIDNPDGYIYAAARNGALRLIRRRTLRDRILKLLKHDETPVGMGAGSGDIALWIESVESQAALQNAIDRLPARTRSAFALRWQHGASYAEVATALGISVKGVEKLLSTGMRKVRLAMTGKP